MRFRRGRRLIATLQHLTAGIVAVLVLDEVRVRYLRRRQHNLLRYKCIHYRNPYYLQPSQLSAPPAPIEWYWQASYPGSGADMHADLTRQLTGHQTAYTEDLDELAQLPGHTLAVKTHWPSIKYFYEGEKTPSPQFLPQFWKDVPMRPDGDNNGNKYDPRQYAGRVLLLLRHPMDSIPSYFNAIYEEENGMEGHSTHAPLMDWVRWRDYNFNVQLMSWVNHTRYWLDYYPDAGRRYISSYESITNADEKYGKMSALKLAGFLRETSGVNTALLDSEDEVACTWYQVVVDSRGGTQRSTDTKNGDPTYVRPYDNSQLDRMEAELTKLKDDYGGRHNRDAAGLLGVYLQMLRDKREKKTMVYN